MEETKSGLDVHVFVCTNEKKGKECCAEKGAEDFRKELKDWVKEHPDWRKRIRINAAGCLDHCKEGIAIAIYPQDKLLLNVSAKKIEDVQKIIEELMA
jgi:predicted metal-binding protein